MRAQLRCGVLAAVREQARAAPAWCAGWPGSTIAAGSPRRDVRAPLGTLSRSASAALQDCGWNKAWTSVQSNACRRLAVWPPYRWVSTTDVQTVSGSTCGRPCRPSNRPALRSRLEQAGIKTRSGNLADLPAHRRDQFRSRIAVGNDHHVAIRKPAFVCNIACLAQSVSVLCRRPCALGDGSERSNAHSVDYRNKNADTNAASLEANSNTRRGFFRWYRRTPIFVELVGIAREWIHILSPRSGRALCARGTVS
jgi:hypothetical protein